MAAMKKEGQLASVERSSANASKGVETMVTSRRMREVCLVFCVFNRISEMSSGPLFGFPEEIYMHASHVSQLPLESKRRRGQSKTSTGKQ